jgi:hypothetical protein
MIPKSVNGALVLAMVENPCGFAAVDQEAVMGTGANSNSEASIQALGSTLFLKTTTLGMIPTPDSWLVLPFSVTDFSARG